MAVSSKDRVIQQLRACQPGTTKWIRRLQEGIQDRESGWFRLAVQLKDGEVSDMQVLADEKIPVNVNG